MAGPRQEPAPEQPQTEYQIHDLKGTIMALDRATGKTFLADVDFEGAVMKLTVESGEDYEIMPGIILHGQQTLKAHIEVERFVQRRRVEREKVEGEPGTFSHCGNHRPHAAHPYSFAMNEGPYHVTCGGTTHEQAQAYESKQRRRHG